MGSSAMLLCFVAALTLPGVAVTSDPGQDACALWSQMAKHLGSGNSETCTSPSPPNCTRLDCLGTVRFSHFLLPGAGQIEIDYCFGTQLNSCTQPVSMDFYLQLPKFNLNKSFRVSEDQDIDLSDVKLPIGPMGTASPLLEFKFERQPDGKSIAISVVSKVKVTQGGHSIFIDELERNLIDQEIIHTLPCPGGPTPAQDSQPPNSWMPAQCQPKKVPSSTMKPPATVSPVPASRTLGQTCDISNVCSDGELCDTNQSPAKCICSPDLSLSQDKKTCVKQSRISQNCQVHSDCGYNELCQLDSAKTFKCQCDQGNEFDTVRKMCVRPPHDHKHTATPGPTTTVTPAQSTKKSSKGKGGKHAPVTPKGSRASARTDTQAKSGESKVPIIVGATLGAFALLTGVVIANIYLFRRYRRRQQRGESGLISESSAPLLGSDDDEANLIM